MMSRVLKVLISLACLLVIGVADKASAQQNAKRQNPNRARGNRTAARKATAAIQQDEKLSSSIRQDPAVEAADVSITATVKARSLRFDVVPTATVEFPGRPQRDTVWEAERENLPSSVQPGVTYRDIGIRLKITSVFSDIDRIVAEALGEVPVNDSPPGAKSQQALPAKTAAPGSPPPPPRERP